MARILLLVDLQEFSFQIKGRVDGKKSSENDKSTDHFQSFF